MDMETLEKLRMPVAIIEIIVCLIVIVLHVTGIAKVAINVWEVYLITLALIFGLIVLTGIAKGKEIEKIVGPFSKCAIFLLMVMLVVDYLSKLTPTQEIGILICWWSVAMSFLIGIILTWEQSRGTGDKASEEGTSHNPVTNRPENISNASSSLLRLIPLYTPHVVQ